MFAATLAAIVAIFVVPAFWAPTALGPSIVWSLIGAAFPLSLASLILINLKGTLQRRLTDVRRQIQQFEGSLRAKLESERQKPADQQNSERMRTWTLNLDGLDEQRRGLDNSYKLERFHGGFAFLAAVYSFGFFFTFNSFVPISDFGTLQATLARFPHSAMAALVGAWAYALYSVIARISTADQSPQFVLRLSYQPIIAASVAYFATFMFADDFILFLSFGIGFLPYSEIVRWIRVQTQKRLSASKADQAATVDAGNSQLAEIGGIDFDEIDRLHEENIKNIQQLAFSNPLEVHFSTAYPLKTVIDWTDQALLRLYLKKETIDKLQPLGIRGAIEMAQVRRRLREFEARAKQAKADGDTQAASALAADSDALLKAVAAATGTDPSAVRYLAYQLGEDPHIEFIYFLYDELATAA